MNARQRADHRSQTWTFRAVRSRSQEAEAPCEADTAEARFLAVFTLSAQVWALSGRPTMAEGERASMPGRVIRREPA